MLAMSLPAPVVLAALLLEDENLSRSALGDDFTADREAGDRRLSDPDVSLAGREQHVGELDGASDLAGKLLDANEVPRSDAVLLASGADHCVVHRWRTITKPVAETPFL
jgi:hypothetical protein